MNKSKVNIPLIILGSIFILLIICVNSPFRLIGESYYERLNKSLSLLINEECSIDGTIGIRSKKEDIFLLDNMSVMFKGVISNREDEPRFLVTLSVDNSINEIVLGDIFLIDKRLYFQIPSINNNYYLDIINDSKKDNITIEEIKKIYQYIDKDKIIGSRDSISINDKSMKIVTSKISIMLSKDDILEIINDSNNVNLYNELEGLNLDDISINCEFYVDNEDYLRKLNIVLENREFEIYVECHFDDYKKISDIQLDNTLDNYLDIRNIDEDEVLEIISKILL